MKTADFYIDRILLNQANLDYIATKLRINGTLYTSLKELFIEAQKEAYNMAIDDAAENATLRFIPFSDNMDVDQESILKLKK